MIVREEINDCVGDGKWFCGPKMVNDSGGGDIVRSRDGWIISSMWSMLCEETF